MNYLGVDVGLKHFGIAFADGPLARPLPSLAHQSLATSVTHLLSLANTHDVEVIVLGLPKGELVPLVHSLAKALSRLSSLSVILHPETLSTKDAIAKLREAGAGRKKLKDAHSFAACLILEDYLESLP